MNEDNQLDTEQMLLIMKLAGWKYVKETRRRWAHLTNAQGAEFSDLISSRYGSPDPADAFACQTDDENIRVLFSKFLKRTGAQ